jgi:hypothetical protein
MGKLIPNYSKPANNKRKLSNGQALFIRSVGKRVPMRELAWHFKVTLPVIRDIRRGATYYDIVMDTASRMDFRMACVHFNVFPTPQYDA